MKKEVLQSIEREKKISLLAISRINNLIESYEKKYGWSTNQFIRKFNDGQSEMTKIFFDSIL